MDTVTEKPQHVPVDVLMHYARWMIGFAETHSAPTGLRFPYADMQVQVEKSKIQAGGPAWRLADAIWWHRYRLLFPRPGPTAAIITREQNAFAALQAHHSPEKARRYRVWQATEAFIALRQAHFGTTPLLAVTDEPPPGTQEDPVRRALYRLDVMWRLKGYAYLGTCLSHLAVAWPLEEELLTAAADAAIALAQGDDGALNRANRLLGRKPWQRGLPLDKALHTLNIARKKQLHAA